MGRWEESQGHGVDDEALQFLVARAPKFIPQPVRVILGSVFASTNTILILICVTRYHNIEVSIHALD